MNMEMGGMKRIDLGAIGYNNQTVGNNEKGNSKKENPQGAQQEIIKMLSEKPDLVKAISNLSQTQFTELESFLNMEGHNISVLKNLGDDEQEVLTYLHELALSQDKTASKEISRRITAIL